MPTPRALLRDLRDAGVDVDDIWTLVNTRQRYSRAIPVLVDWLEHLSDRDLPEAELPRLREAIVRALRVKEARPAAAHVLISQFRAASQAGQSSLAWAVGNSVGFVADDSCYSELVELATDQRFGMARQMIVFDGLARMRDPDATLVLLGLLEQPDVNGHAIAALAKRRDPRARVAFEQFTNDDRAWVRREAKKGLARLAS